MLGPGKVGRPICGLRGNCPGLFRSLNPDPGPRGGAAGVAAGGAGAGAFVLGAAGVVVTEGIPPPWNNAWTLTFFCLLGVGVPPGGVGPAAWPVDAGVEAVVAGAVLAGVGCVGVGATTLIPLVGGAAWGGFGVVAGTVAIAGAVAGVGAVAGGVAEAGGVDSAFFSGAWVASIEPKLIELVWRCPVPATTPLGACFTAGWAFCPSVLWRRGWVFGAFALAGDWARDVAELCGGPLDHAELASGTDEFDALFCVGLTELLIECYSSSRILLASWRTQSEKTNKNQS